MITTSLISSSDLAEFLRQPADVQADVQSWINELSAVRKPIQKNLAAVAARMGVSLQTARRKYDAWRHSGDWRSLRNLLKVPEERGLDPEFIAFWQGLCKENQRKCKPAYKKFVRLFLAGEPMPGIDANVSRVSLPRGYSYDNLMRHRPSDFELTAVRIGRSAAAEFRPKIFTTRKELAVGKMYLFDDMWHDFVVCKYPQRRPMRLLQLHAHDVFAACQFARGLKPRERDEITGKSVNLNENEMLFLVAYVLGEFGFHPEGTVLGVEHGTAAIKDALERMIYDLTAGRVTVEAGGIQSAPSFAGQYPGASKGNFRFKAALESLGNLIHNETADMLTFPGQTGSNSRINKPEELGKREDAAAVLIKAMAALPAERANQLRMPVLEVNQAKWLVEEVMERINRRVDHELEGWLDAGLTTVDYEIPDVGIITAQKWLTLSADKQAALAAVAMPAPRKMSPREVFDAGRPRLIRMRPEQTALMLRDTAGREVTVGKDHLISFEDENISTEPLRFLAHHFAPGDKFRAVVNPMSPNIAHLFDARGSWIGQVSAWQTVSQGDTAALNRAMGAARKVEAELLAPVARTGARITKERIEAAQHNAGVLRDPVEVLSAAEKKIIRTEGAEAAEDFLSGAAPKDRTGEAPTGDIFDLLNNP